LSGGEDMHNHQGREDENFWKRCRRG
jgi:hypothetical protein